MMSAVRQENENGVKFMTVCEYDPSFMQDLATLTKENAKLAHDNLEAVKSLTQSVETLGKYHREMTRALLVVVCIIALGQKAVEMVRDIWGHKVTVEQAK